MNGNTSLERVKKEIFKRLFTRRYSPGERLVESKLAKELDMSRTPVRLAFMELVEKGLLERGENGCFVPLISAEDMSSVFEARAGLEGQAAYLAAQKASDECVASLKELLRVEEQLYSCPDFEERYTEHNHQFHLCIASGSCNPYLLKYVDQIYWRSQIYVFFFDRFYREGSKGMNPRDQKSNISFGEHERLVEMIASRNCNMAKKCMEEHVMSTYMQSIRCKE